MGGGRECLNYRVGASLSSKARCACVLEKPCAARELVQPAYQVFCPEKPAYQVFCVKITARRDSHSVQERDLKTASFESDAAAKTFRRKILRTKVTRAHDISSATCLRFALNCRMAHDISSTDHDHVESRSRRGQLGVVARWRALGVGRVD